MSGRHARLSIVVRVRAGRDPADVVDALARLIDDAPGAAAFRTQAIAALAARPRLPVQRAS